MKRFLSAYFRSMRPYYGFVTLAAGLAGAAAAPGDVSPARLAAVLAIMYVGWGVNQVLNDATNRREDAVNAPDRPMVTGELRPAPAIALSAAVILAALLWCAFSASADVVVSDCVFHSQDDAFVFRSHQEQLFAPRPLERVVISNCVCSTCCACFRFGWSGDWLVRDVSIDNVGSLRFDDVSFAVRPATPPKTVPADSVWFDNCDDVSFDRCRWSVLPETSSPP